MNTLLELRKNIKPLGYNVKSKGGYVIYSHIESKQELDFNVFTPELLERWTPLFTYMRECREQLRELREHTGLMGILKI